MPSLDTVRLFRSIRRVTTPQINSYEIIRDTSFIGQKVKINWNYQNANIVGFRVWRAVSKKVLLKRNYLIPQIALERLTGLKTFYMPNTALFNKQFFSQNSKVKFFQSNSDRFIKPDEEPEIDFHRFVDIGFIRKNRKQSYEFVDKRVKFGETYLYIISALTTSFFDSEKSLPVTVRVEDLEHPDAPEDIKLFLSSNGVAITIGTSVKANDVMGFDIFRREEGKEKFEKIAEIVADELEFINFIDFDVIPGRTYIYKVYSRDFYGNLNFWSKEHRISYDAGFIRKRDVPPPDITIEIDSGEVILRGNRNHSETIGYRFERRDAWKFEEGFEIKDFITIPWPNVNLFDESGSAELIDRTVVSGNIYQYRASSIKRNGVPATFLITPHIRIQDGFIFPELSDEDTEETMTDLLDFNARLEDAKQSPIFTKFSWDIEGEWSYIVLEIIKGTTFEGAEVANPETIIQRIDNIHEKNQIYFTKLELGNSYEIRVKVFDVNAKLLDETNKDEVTRISI